MEIHTWTKSSDYWTLSVLVLKLAEIPLTYLKIAGLYRAVQRIQRRNTKPDKTSCFTGYLWAGWLNSHKSHWKPAKFCLWSVANNWGYPEWDTWQAQWTFRCHWPYCPGAQFIFLTAGEQQHFKILILFGAPEFLILFRYSESIWIHSWVMCSWESCLSREVGLNDFQWSFPILSILWSPNWAI